MLVLAPMLMELKAVAKALSLDRQPEGEEPSYRGQSPPGPVAAVLGGIGFAASSGVVDRLLEQHAYDRVVVCGIAGGLRPGIAVGDVVVPERVLDLESGAEYRPAPLTGMDNAGTLVCHTEFIVDPDAVNDWIERGYSAIDMETSAVAEVCERRGCAWSVVRAISDQPSDHVDGAAIELTNTDGSVRAGAAARYMLSHPGRIPKLLALGKGASRAARNAAIALDVSLRAS